MLRKSVPVFQRNRPAVLPKNGPRFILHYRNDPEGQFLTWNLENFLKVPDHLHECVLYRILNIALLFQNTHRCPFHLDMIPSRQRNNVAETNANGLKANSEKRSNPTFHTVPTQLHSAKSAMSQMTHRFSLLRRGNQRGKSAYSLPFLRRCFFASTRLDCDLYLP